MPGSVAEEYIYKFREIHEFLRKEVLKGSHHAHELEFERLPYFLTCAFRAAASFVENGRSVGMRLAPADGEATPFITGNELASLCVPLESFLTTCVKAQNAFIPYFRAFQTNKTSLNGSLNKLTKQIADGTAKFDQWLDTALMNYWRNHGERLRDYRDFAEHFSLVFSTALVNRIETSIRIRLLLPANPEIKAPHQLVFTPEVHAVEYVILELAALFDFADQLIAELFSRYPELNNHSVTPDGVFQFRPPLKLGSGEGYLNFCLIPEETEFLTKLRNASSNSPKEASAHSTGTNISERTGTVTVLPVNILTPRVPPTAAASCDLSKMFADFAAKTVVYIERTFGAPPQRVTGSGTVIGAWGKDPTDISRPIIATAGHLLSGDSPSHFRISMYSLADRKNRHERILDFDVDGMKCDQDTPGMGYYNGAHHEILDFGMIRAPSVCTDGKGFFQGKPLESIMPTETGWNWELEGTKVAWAGFPEAAAEFARQPQLCYFEGRVSAFVFHDEYQGYLLDSPNTELAIGGPVWSQSDQDHRVRMIGLICGYRSSGSAPRLIQVTPIQHLCKYIKSQ